MKNLDLIWKKVLTSIKKEITPTSFKTWFMPLKAVKIDNDLNLLNLSIHDPFFMGVLKERYIGIIERAVKDVLKKPYKVAIELESDIAEDETENSLPFLGSKNYKIVSEPVFNNEFILDPNYSFDNFIVGDNNKYAYVASLAVAESPSELYNPLFIYGGSGLGKTHLMHAIGHFVLENHTHLKVLYISSEMFTNEFIKALGNSKKTGGMSAFQRKYRSIDVLLIDDIQFIEGKEATETEFFNTFNRLYESNKQIIISSDRALEKQKMARKTPSVKTVCVKCGEFDVALNFKKGVKTTRLKVAKIGEISVSLPFYAAQKYALEFVQKHYEWLKSAHKKTLANLPREDEFRLLSEIYRIKFLCRSEERRVGKECRSRWSPYH